MNAPRHELVRALIAVAVMVAVVYLLALKADWDERREKAKKEPLIQGILIHHSASPPTIEGKRVDAAMIDGWHKKRGFTSTVAGEDYHIGYNFVILPDGTIEKGRPVGSYGAHAGSIFYNQHFIGVCLIGDFDDFDNPNGKNGPKDPSPRQLTSLRLLCDSLAREFNFSADAILPHRAVRDTACPGSRFPLSWLRTAVDNDLHPIRTARR